MASLRKKLVVVGDGACGKTSLLMRFHEGRFPDHYIPTVFENRVTDLLVDSRRVELALWDTAGQEQFDHLRSLSYPGADIVLICFAIDSPVSLDNVVEKWMEEVRHFCPKTPIFLIGLKKDVRTDPRVLENMKRTHERPVATAEGEAVARRIGADRYLECSARTGEGVTDVFETATRYSLRSSPTAPPGTSAPVNENGGCCIIL
ncbi:ras-like GTP-binding protein Rho1 [Gonapodya prolifera JEL478]|uniref:Ras-like GTP-binding protein Rho1 n=1 Tax=Gonapodya prolifera (strain JEL478) TaxID=1344416 RepID=A0A139AQI2_GONPJ|nr:ras-like GTP-binding protein Rho1 [Gonapodya prolifera JEL478]|eukprot:KXS19010.1 ras-like GTP-binding protein Rho1 [Gonapodya prolifera JEL478]